MENMYFVLIASIIIIFFIPFFIHPVPACGITSCHGLDLSCGGEVPLVCTEMYQLGDFCREYFNCSYVNGSCGAVSSIPFVMCKGCVRVCEAEADPWACESVCRERMSKYCEADSDCACGRHIFTGECFYGSKNLVNSSLQCPDFCTGISGGLSIKCVNSECVQS